MNLTTGMYIVIGSLYTCDSSKFFKNVCVCVDFFHNHDNILDVSTFFSYVSMSSVLGAGFLGHYRTL